MRIATGDNGIPGDYPVRVVREDPDRQGLLYAGTEFGMFISFDDGGEWRPLQLNLPVTPVTDIKVVDQDLVLSTMGRGFWILYDLTPFHEMDAETAEANHLFQVKPAYRLYTARRFGGGRASHGPQYPSPGANIDYFLESEPSGELKLEMLDADGEVARAFSEAHGEKNVLPEESSMCEWSHEVVGNSELPINAGMHRFLWDLRHAGPWHKETERSGRKGPLVAPGIYRARLTTGDWSRTVSFEVKMDPRVVGEGQVTEEDVRAQVALALKVRDSLSDARLAAANLEKSIEEASDDEKGVLVAIKDELVTSPIRYSQPMLVDQLVYLYGNLQRADQRPGRDAVERWKSLNEALRVLLSELEQILGPTE